MGVQVFFICLLFTALGYAAYKYTDKKYSK